MDHEAQPLESDAPFFELVIARVDARTSSAKLAELGLLRNWYFLQYGFRILGAKSIVADEPSGRDN